MPLPSAKLLLHHQPKGTVMGMETLALNIDRIEKALTDRGYTTIYLPDDGMTVYNIQHPGSPVTIEVFDAVSGGYWKPENTSEAIHYDAPGYMNVTELFAVVNSEQALLDLIQIMFRI